jgi:hypothetical protein
LLRAACAALSFAKVTKLIPTKAGVGHMELGSMKRPSRILAKLLMRIPSTDFDSANVHQMLNVKSIRDIQRAMLVADDAVDATQLRHAVGYLTNYEFVAFIYYIFFFH